MPRAQAAGVIRQLSSSTNSYVLRRTRAAAHPVALATQRIGPLHRFLDSAGQSLGVEIKRPLCIAARAIGSPFGKNERVIGFREREACLGIAHFGRALKHDSR